MVIASELYYLNTALDGSEIFGVSKSESVLKKLNGDNSAEESLIKKGILNSDSSINDKSYELIRNLEKYKKANQYINLQDILISVEFAKDECVFIRQAMQSEYMIKDTSKQFLIHYFMKKYPFIAENKESKIRELKIDLNNFKEEYLDGICENEWFYLKRGDFNSCNIFYFYFIKDEVCYRYDVINNILSEISPQNIRIQLLKLFNVKGSYKL